jgi:DNA-directed RNA polymerase subunit F
MNQEQRKRLQEALDILTEIQEQEQEKYDNAPENLQYSEKFEKFQETAESLQEAVDIVQAIVEE